MRQILCFGDSNTWGLDGATGKRLPWGVRWTSRLQDRLQHDQYHIIEEGLCGRTTIFEDPLREGRRGTSVLPVLLETYDDVDDIILMLGTNDCKAAFNASAEMIGKGIVRLLEQIEEYTPNARVLLISPIYLGKNVWKEEYDPEFSKESVEVSEKLERVYERIANDRGISFLKASDYVCCSEKDQEHLDAEGHAVLAEALYKKLQNCRI